MDLEIIHHFIIKEKIGAGSFGEIFKVYDQKSKVYLALKLEFSKSNNLYSQLLLESRIYKLLKNEKGFPRIYWYGNSGKYNCLAMDLLGPSLDELFHFCNKKFSIHTISMIGEQTLSRIESLHNKDYIHRDIKPSNFLIGEDTNSNTIYLIDFGLSKRYFEPLTKIHIPFRDNKALTGTARYASINTHIGFEQSRRDDLEGWIYTLIYFFKGSLQWQGIKGDNRIEKYKKIMESKMSITAENLCKGIPKQIPRIFNYIKSLGFEDKPEYNKIRKNLQEMISGSYFSSFKFDWGNLQIKEEEKLNKKINIVKSNQIEKDSQGNEIEIPNEICDFHKIKEFEFVQNINHFNKYKVYKRFIVKSDPESANEEYISQSRMTT